MGVGWGEVERHSPVDMERTAIEAACLLRGIMRRAMVIRSGREAFVQSEFWRAQMRWQWEATQLRCRVAHERESGGIRHLSSSQLQSVLLRWLAP